jgi:hypothetical protein
VWAFGLGSYTSACTSSGIQQNSQQRHFTLSLSSPIVLRCWLYHCCLSQGKCTFGARLTDEEVQQITQYVLEQAANNWQVQQ